MDLDLEIISEEGDCPDPLFYTIMNAMNSMKEATADKIYQRIQREGETNFSKPQVDRALESALKYGIFEVKNNRYRVRDDILDDEDTVYWSLQKNREQTPFRIQEDINERHFGPKLNPEKDNQRFRKLPNVENKACPQCGRIKKLESKKNKSVKKDKKQKKYIQKKKLSLSCSEKPEMEEELKNDAEPLTKPQSKRKLRYDSFREERRLKIRRMNGFKGSSPCGFYGNYPFGGDLNSDGDIYIREAGKYDSTDESEYDSISSPSDDEQGFTSYSDNLHTSRLESECDDLPNSSLFHLRHKSSTSVKTDTNTEKTEESSFSRENTGLGNCAYEDLSCASKNSESKTNNDKPNKNQPMNELDSSKIYNKQFESDEVEQCSSKPGWIGLSDETKGAIIQSNNVLTIEPMDSFAFTSPKQASYIS